MGGMRLAAGHCCCLTSVWKYDNSNPPELVWNFRGPNQTLLPANPAYEGRLSKLCVDGSQNVYLAKNSFPGDFILQKLSSATPPASSWTFYPPGKLDVGIQDAMLDAAGDFIYVMSGNPSTPTGYTGGIRKLDASGAVIATVNDTVNTTLGTMTLDEANSFVYFAMAFGLQKYTTALVHVTGSGVGVFTGEHLIWNPATSKLFVAGASAILDTNTALTSQSVFAIYVAGRLAVDSSGNVYAAARVGHGNDVRKFNSAGVQQWSYTHGATVRDLAVDGSGNVYFCGDVSGGNQAGMLDASGTLVWSISIPGLNSLYTLALDGSQNLYLGTFAVVRQRRVPA